MGAVFVGGGGVGNFLLLGRSENEHQRLRNASKIDGYIEVEKDGTLEMGSNRQNCCSKLPCVSWAANYWEFSVRY